MAILTDNFSGEPFEGKSQTIKLDYGARTDCQPVYVGFAQPGSGTDEAVWKIMFCEYDGTLASGCIISRTWAQGSDGKASFNQIWDNRTTLSYS